MDYIPPLPPKSQKYPARNDSSIKLTQKGTWLLLHKAVHQICAHEGFDSTTESVLSTLVDVTDEMLSKFCKLLKVNTEREVLNLNTGFVVSHQSNLHSSTSIQ